MGVDRVGVKRDKEGRESRVDLVAIARAGSYALSLEAPRPVLLLGFC